MRIRKYNKNETTTSSFIFANTICELASKNKKKIAITTFIVYKQFNLYLFIYFTTIHMYFFLNKYICTYILTLVTNEQG